MAEILLHVVGFELDRTRPADPSNIAWIINGRRRGGGHSGEFSRSLLASPMPVDVTEYDHRPLHYWYFEAELYSTTDSDLTPEDVLALINAATNRRRLKLEKAHALQAMAKELDSRGTRQAIPQETKVSVPDSTSAPLSVPNATQELLGAMRAQIDTHEKRVAKLEFLVGKVFRLLDSQGTASSEDRVIVQRKSFDDF